jgi:hypothetical protein
MCTPFEISIIVGHTQRHNTGWRVFLTNNRALDEQLEDQQHQAYKENDGENMPFHMRKQFNDWKREQAPLLPFTIFHAEKERVVTTQALNRHLQSPISACLAALAIPL